MDYSGSPGSSPKKKNYIYHKRYYHKPQHFLFQQDSELDEFDDQSKSPESRFPVFSASNIRAPHHRHPILCSNCNEKGHFFKDCTKPILSYGILAWTLKPKADQSTQKDITFDQKDTKHTFEDLKDMYQANMCDLFVTLIQRKHTIGYEAFIRGKYNSTEELYTHLNRMTVEERTAIKNRRWDDLYDEIIAEKDLRYMQKEKKKAKALYELLDLSSLFENLNSANEIHFETSWEFPKGRRFVHETDFHCALRELQEETNITKDDVIWIDSLTYLKEEFSGTNKKIYLNKYYNALIDPNSKGPFIDYQNPNQLSEVKNAKWFNFNEALNLLHSYCQEKKDVLTASHKYIQKLLKK